jgi:hypothetical protein
MPRYVFARPREQANYKNARDSWSTAGVVVHLRVSECVQRCVVAAVANGVARLDRFGLGVVMVKKTREFLESAKRSFVSARDCRGTCTTDA